MSDRLFGGIGLVLAAFFVWQATTIQEAFISDPIGPKAFPFIIGAALGIASLFVVLRPDAQPQWPTARRFLEILMAVAVMIVYTQLLPVAGFVAASAVAAAYLCWRLGTPPAAAALAGVIIAVGIYVVFHLILGLSLARGPWGF